MERTRILTMLRLKIQIVLVHGEASDATAHDRIAYDLLHFFVARFVVLERSSFTDHCLI